MSATATSDFEAATRSLRDERLIDALAQLLGERPWARISMAAVAERAGMSRQTVYNAFGSREELGRAYVRREADAFLGAIEATLEAHRADPEEAIRPALAMFLTTVEHHPIVQALARGESDELLVLITARDAPLMGEFAARLSASIGRIWSGVSPHDADLLADGFVRLAISHAVLPAAGPAVTAREIAELLSPFATRALERSGD